ncbi:MAG: hypothetical protein KC620_20710, partial [Myxococcales bacterium]|nr:hypothetical protein [Myxococcales bacterium]
MFWRITLCLALLAAACDDASDGGTADVRDAVSPATDAAALDMGPAADGGPPPDADAMADAAPPAV